MNTIPENTSERAASLPAAQVAREAEAPHEQSILVENMFSPELFSSFASSFSVNAGSVTIKFVSLRWDNSTEPAVQKAVVVARITMPLHGAQTLAEGLQSFLAQNGLQNVPMSRPRTRSTDVLAASPVRTA